jgi:hypothetical protein
MALERGTTPTHSRRACSPRYELLSCQRDWAGVAQGPCSSQIRCHWVRSPAGGRGGWVCSYDGLRYAGRRREAVAQHRSVRFELLLRELEARHPHVLDIEVVGQPLVAQRDILGDLLPDVLRATPVAPRWGKCESDCQGLASCTGRQKRALERRDTRTFASCV